MKYTIAEFRKNTREILNAVDQGAEVVITRYDTEYLITGLVSDAEAQEVAKHVTPEMEAGWKQKDKLFKAPKKNIAIGKPIKSKVSDKQLKAAMNKGFGNLLISEDGICEHGYAKGNCKKENCNRKYRG